jgi:hypothetical protein
MPLRRNPNNAAAINAAKVARWHDLLDWALCADADRRLHR